ncbi:hypothetical protein K437DRAFT_250787 [Tilletiaria anomala UBC 951]|uniref:tRNA (guanine(10)-N(2))-methyltransferase n=1 Tax=Tilletiaria anomala (strain ATCC 24038 / CBS 436.72 / UBC 951) TaxID=1037660 RepID=A0A066VC43_TILAU|nr:uncharacterized protein K437DRAFT_250787 [Tilletiaria anomala UBC 951]KDN39312.1 hypothetical protein K437DRAFT_250787 [Tilletiaria anomala UBC 951]
MATQEASASINDALANASISAGHASRCKDDSMQSNIYAIFFSDANLNFALSEWLAVTEYLGVAYEVVPWSSTLSHLASVAPQSREAAQLYSQGSSNKRIHNEQTPEWDSPFVLFHIPAGNEAVERICKRSVAIKDAWELWAEAADHAELHAKLQSPQGNAKWQKYCDERTSWKFDVLNFGYRISEYEQRALFQGFSYMAAALTGDIKMKGAELLVGVVQLHEKGLAAEASKEARRAEKAKTGHITKPQHIFVGRKLQIEFGRDKVDVFDVKKRVYIGNTTMESEMSLRMALMGLAGPGKIIYDPFTGTGSMLHAASLYDAYVLGAEIDVRALRGKELAGPGKTGIMKVAEQYGCTHRYLDCLHMDFTQPAWRKEVYRDQGLFDAIITDPPYGVRAGAKKLGLRANGRHHDGPVIMPDGTPAHLTMDYHPPMRAYHLQDLLTDLMKQSSRLLKDDGRLVFFVPSISEEEDKKTHVPEHPDLVLIAKNYQDFGYWGRILITMRRKRRTDGASGGFASDRNGSDTGGVRHDGFISSSTTSFSRANEDAHEFRNLFHNRSM